MEMTDVTGAVTQWVLDTVMIQALAVGDVAAAVTKWDPDLATIQITIMETVAINLTETCMAIVAQTVAGALVVMKIAAIPAVIHKSNIWEGARSVRDIPRTILI